MRASVVLGVSMGDWSRCLREDIFGGEIEWKIRFDKEKIWYGYNKWIGLREGKAAGDDSRVRKIRNRV